MDQAPLVEPLEEWEEEVLELVQVENMAGKGVVKVVGSALDSSDGYDIIQSIVNVCIIEIIITYQNLCESS